MGWDGKYGQVITEHGQIPLDEPVIVFRAADAVIADLIEAYQDLCEEAGSPQRHLDMAASTRDRFEAWQREHPDLVKVPDSERSRKWLGERLNVREET